MSTPRIMKLHAENEKLREALEVAEQALMEVRHAQTCGSEWYTRGASGLRMQVSMWVDRGLTAINSTKGEHPCPE